MNECILQQYGFYSLSGTFWGEMLSENHNALRKDLVTRSKEDPILDVKANML